MRYRHAVGMRPCRGLGDPLRVAGVRDEELPSAAADLPLIGVAQREVGWRSGDARRQGDEAACERRRRARRQRDGDDAGRRRWGGSWGWRRRGGGRGSRRRRGRWSRGRRRRRSGGWRCRWSRRGFGAEGDASAGYLHRLGLRLQRVGHASREAVPTQSDSLESAEIAQFAGYRADQSVPRQVEVFEGGQPPQFLRYSTVEPSTRQVQPRDALRTPLNGDAVPLAHGRVGVPLEVGVASQFVLRREERAAVIDEFGVARRVRNGHAVGARRLLGGGGDGDDEREGDGGERAERNEDSGSHIVGTVLCVGFGGARPHRGDAGGDACPQP